MSASLTAVANNMGTAFQGQVNGLQGQINGLQGQVNGLQGQVNGMQGQINNNLREARAGIALAMAAGSLQFDSRPGKVSFAGAYGNFKGLFGSRYGHRLCGHRPAEVQRDRLGHAGPKFLWRRRVRFGHAELSGLARSMARMR